MTNLNPDDGLDPRPDGGPVKQAREMLGQAAGTVKQETAHFAEMATDQVRAKAEEGKETATRTIGEFANAIRKAGEELSQHDQSMAGRVVKQAADGLENFSRSITDKGPEDILRTVRDFGRNNPTAFIGGAVLLGLALGRFARSSAPEGAVGSAYRPGQGFQTGQYMGGQSQGQAGQFQGGQYQSWQPEPGAYTGDQNQPWRRDGAQDAMELSPNAGDVTTAGFDAPPPAFDDADTDTASVKRSDREP